MRGAPPGLPFKWDAETLERGLNFTLVSSLGSIDLLGDITGGGSYDDILSGTEVLTAYCVQCRCLVLDRLIQVKRATASSTNQQGWQFDVARDGRFLINSVVEETASPITLIQNWTQPAAK